MVRDCSSEEDVLCDTIENGGDVGGVSIIPNTLNTNHPTLQTTQFCNCNTALCNFDWSTAGSTQPTEATTTAAATKVTLASAVTVWIVTALFRLL